MATLGILVAVSGVPLIVVGPGYTPGVTAAIPYLGLTILIGGLVTLFAAGWAIGQRRGEHFSPIRPNRFSSAAVLAVGVSVVCVGAALSLGALPGMYYPASGSKTLLIGYCGGYLLGGQGPSSPFAFPPWSQVHLDWTTTNGTPINLTISQSPPNAPEKLTLLETFEGSSGTASLVGSGGVFGLVPLTGSFPCPNRESVTVNWHYTLV